MELETVIIFDEHDPYPDLSWLEQDHENDGEGEDANRGLKRLATFGDEWTMIGIIALARFIDDDGAEIKVEQAVFGVESDSDSAHKQDLAEDLIAELRTSMELDPKLAPFSDFSEDLIDWRIF